MTWAGRNFDVVVCFTYLYWTTATALGNDTYSEGIVSFASAEGLATELMLRVPGRRPGLCLIDPDPAGPVIQVAVNALAVAERAEYGLVLVRRRDPEQRHDVGHLAAFGRTEREHPGQAVGHLLAQQVTGILRDQDQRGVPRPAHP